MINCKSNCLLLLQPSSFLYGSTS